MVHQASAQPLFADNALKDRVYLITGASSGIGAATAILLSGLGAKVILVGRDREKLECVAGKLLPFSSYTVQLDLALPGSLFDSVKSLPDEWLPLHGAFHSAGAEFVRPVRLTKPADFDYLMATSVRSAFDLGRVAASKALMREGSSLIYMSSVAAITGTTGLALYSAAKGSIDGMVRSLAIELAPRQIRVNSIISGAIQTPMHDRLTTSLSKEAVDDYQMRHPLGFGQPSDISQLVVFLFSDAGRWITGSSIVVDGGYSVP
jgi:NAD(P)-dependent dehydrogenase (short-subunit alcohol dehydrogenase family)